MITEEEYLKAKQIVQEYEKQLDISNVSCSYIDKLIDDDLMCEDCYENGYSYDFKNWLFLERMVIK